jgi:hypothetical protein
MALGMRRATFGPSSVVHQVLRLYSMTLPSELHPKCIHRVLVFGGSFKVCRESRVQQRKNVVWRSPWLQISQETAKEMIGLAEINKFFLAQ